MKSKATQTNSPDQIDHSAPFARIQELLERSNQIAVATHIDPDGDAIGTQLAFGAYLRWLGKPVTLVREAPVPARYAFLTGSDDIVDIDSLPEEFHPDTVLILECPSASRLGKANRLLQNGVTVVNIDHHRDNGLFGDVFWVNPQASSVGEMAYEYFSWTGFRIDATVAEQLYTAILTDTGRFRFSSTTARTMEIAGALVAAGADPQRICEDAFYNLEPSTMKLMGKVLNSIEYHDNGTICFLTLTREMIRDSGADWSESEGVVDFTLFTRQVRVGALFKEGNSGGTRVSLRSRNSVDVASLAAQFGGGGHPNAAGCSLPMPLAETKQTVLEALRKIGATNG